MTDKVWLKQYPKGVPAEIDYSAYTSVKQLFESCCTKFKDLPAYSNLGCTISYGDLDAKTRDFAAFLQSLPGLSGIPAGANGLAARRSMYFIE